MSTSQAAGVNVIPFLARIVLAAAFIPAGWNKLMSETIFEGEDAATLRSIGAAGSGAAAGNPTQPGGSSGEGGKTSALFGPGATGGWSMLAAAPPAAAPPTQPQSEKPKQPADANPAKPADQPPERATPPDSAPAAPAGGASPAQPAPSPAPASGEEATGPQGESAPMVPPPSGAGTVAIAGDPSPLKAASLHRVTLMVHRHGMAYPVYQAYLATAVELLGGTLILLGLFSRLWGIGLAGVMAVAFWFTSWPLLAAGNPIGSLFSLPVDDFNRMFCQAGLFVLAFGVFLTGPGAASLDRAIFRKAPSEA